MEHRIRSYEIHKGNVADVEQELSTYISQLYLPNRYIEQIHNTDFYNNNPAYYINYPYLFLKTNGSDENIIKLCIAGALYYQSIIYIDRVLDNDIPLADAFLIISVCTEETIKLLSSFISLESGFWEIWNKRKFEYLQAYKDDKSGQITTANDYLMHSGRKAAFGKLAIDSLFYMQLINDEEYKAYLEIHKYFYGAFQIIDDISDIREDYKKKQYNIAIAEVVNTQKKTDTFDSGEAISEVFYTEHFYERLFALAGNWADKARKIAKQYNLNYMIEECNKLWNTIVIQQQNVNTYLYQLNVMAELSKERPANNNIEEACIGAFKYLKNHQEPNGCWIDFCNNAGASDCWCTAFVTLMLKNFKPATQITDKAKEYLRKNIQTDLWGYSHIWIEDNDSSCMAILATDDYTRIESLLWRFNPDGGMPTYYDDNKLLSSLSYLHQYNGNIEGWRQSHPDVSALALYLFSKASYAGIEFNRLLSYIKKRIRNKQPLVYWWIDDIYTLFFLSLANSTLKDQELDDCIRQHTAEKHERLVENKNNDNITVFHVAMLLHLLIYCGKKKEADEIACFLIKLQYTDGSWPESNFMCMPAADCTTPLNTISWEVADHGINIRAHEFHRIYTTSLALMALSEYKSYGEKY